MEGNINYSIIVPHKNIPNLLQRCIESIPRRKDIQVIVIDDNSDPNLVNFDNFPGYGEECVEVVFTKKGKGAGYARNIGLSLAKGRWILFADADDFYNDNLLETIDSYLDSEKDIIFFCVNCVYSENITKVANRPGVQKLQEYYELFKKNRKEAEYYYRYKFTEPWGKMIKKRLIDENKIYFDEVMVSNDYMFSVKTGFYSKSVDASNIAIYTLTLREGSLCYDFAQTYEKLEIKILVAADVTLFFNSKRISYSISPLRGLLVTLLKRKPKKFIPIIYLLHKKGLNVIKLLLEIFNHK